MPLTFLWTLSLSFSLLTLEMGENLRESLSEKKISCNIWRGFHSLAGELFTSSASSTAAIKRNYVNLVNQFLQERECSGVKRLEKWGDIKIALKEIKCQCIIGTLLTIFVHFSWVCTLTSKIKWKSPPIKIKFNAIASNESERERKREFYIELSATCNLPHTNTIPLILYEHWSLSSLL